MVAQRTVNPCVAGSSPARGAILPLGVMAAQVILVHLVKVQVLQRKPCGCGVVVAHEPSKLLGRVRIPSAAPFNYLTLQSVSLT